jgi:hypothetical protein
MNSLQLKLATPTGSTVYGVKWLNQQGRWIFTPITQVAYSALSIKPLFSNSQYIQPIPAQVAGYDGTNWKQDWLNEKVVGLGGCAVFDTVSTKIEPGCIWVQPSELYIYTDDEYNGTVLRLTADQYTGTLPNITATITLPNNFTLNNGVLQWP